MKVFLHETRWPHVSTWGSMASVRECLLFQYRQTDHNSLVFAAAPPSWTKPTKTGSHLDTLVLIGWAFHTLYTSVTLLLTAGADHKVLSPIQRNKIQEVDCEKPSILSLNRLSWCLFIAYWITIIVTQRVVTWRKWRMNGWNQGRGDIIRKLSVFQPHGGDANWSLITFLKNILLKGSDNSNPIHIGCFPVQQLWLIHTYCKLCSTYVSNQK